MIIVHSLIDQESLVALATRLAIGAQRGIWAIREKVCKFAAIIKLSK